LTQSDLIHRIKIIK